MGLLDGEPMNPATDQRDRRLALGIAVVAMLASCWYALYGGAPADALIGPIVVAGSFVFTGYIAWVRRPANRIGRLMIALGVSLLLIAFAAPPWLVLYPIGLAAFVSASVLLGYLFLAFPSGRLHSNADRGLIVLTALLVTMPRVIRLLVTDPAAGGSDLVNPYLLIHDAGLVSLSATLPYWADVVVVVAFLVVIPVRWLRASPPARRMLLPVLGPSIVLLVVLLLDALSIVLGASASVRNFFDTAQLAARALFPIGFLIALLQTRIARSAVADLVVELGHTPAPARLRDALANALGDPSLAVAYWSPAAGSFVDAAGLPADLPAEGSGRAVTLLERDGTPMAAIAHDAALLEDPGLVASVASAMRLAVENERLQGEVETQLEEVRASRARIVTAGDAERKRLERDLHDGAQQRLVSLSLALRLARTRLGDDLDPAALLSLDQASAEAKAALSELRELARGIHPQILTEAGLGPAVESLAARSPVDVGVEIDDRRFSPAVEAAAYFVVSEALANIAKYAQAGHALVRSSVAADRLTVEISDDGIGGANPATGSGLRGLVDRLSAVDGTLEIFSPRGGGTRLVASIPMRTPAEVPG